jgi:hypothetical protein
MRQCGLDLFQELQAFCFFPEMVHDKGFKHPDAFLNGLPGEPDPIELP